VRLSLVDRVVDVIEEGIDVAIRIADLADSSLVAARIGEVRRVACASPAYLKEHAAPRAPADLARHQLIAFSQLTPTDTWTFGARRVAVRPRLSVNTAEAAIASALAGGGITCVLSYQIDAELRAGRLVRVLASHEPPPVPVHAVYAAGSILSAKVRAFIDFAVPRLRKALAPSA
jgi:DNA-binding transcriptional LysR family regulator